MAELCLECLKHFEPNANESNVILTDRPARCDGCGCMKQLVLEFNDDTLTGEELNSLNQVICDTIDALVTRADKHNIDRDSFVKYFAAVFSTMAEISTFKKWGKPSE